MTTLHNYSSAFMRRSLFAVLCMVLSTALMYSTSYAAECEEGSCKRIKIVNRTDVDLEIRFLLCCNGELERTECKEVIAGTSLVEFSPNCTLLRWAFCNQLTPRICTKWYEDECVLVIDFCNRQ